MRCAILLFLVTLLASWSGCVIPAPKDVGIPAETAPGEVNFELAAPNDAAIIVPVKINGKGPYKFVLDTGATFTCIDQKLVDELKLPECPQRRKCKIGEAGHVRSGKLESHRSESLRDRILSFANGWT